MTMVRRFLVPVFATLLAVGLAPRGAHADGAYDDAAAGDVLVSPLLDASSLPAPPRGYRTLQRDEARYDLPANLVSELDELERHRVRAWTRIGNDLGIALPDSLILRIARNPDEMFAMAPRGLPPPSYASGVAYPELGLVLLTVTTRDPADPTPDLRRVLTHELSHVALHRAAGGRPIPRWFSEGIAVHHADEYGIERIRTLWEGASSGRLAPLRGLTVRFADGSPDVGLAYAQSADVVAFLLRRPHGSDKMRRMLGAIRDGKDFEAAMKSAFGFDLDHLEREWRADLDERHSAYPVVLGGGGLWALVVVALAIGYFRKRRRNRATLKRWANEEAAIDSLEAELRRKAEALEREAERQAALERDAAASDSGRDEADDDSGEPPSGRVLH